MTEEPNIFSPINLGSLGQFIMVELAGTVMQLVCRAPKRTSIPLPIDDSRQRQLRSALARDRSNWGPYVPLDESFKRTVCYFTQRLEG